jgi:hypothetical protein
LLYILWFELRKLGWRERRIKEGRKRGNFGNDKRGLGIRIKVLLGEGFGDIR